MKVGTDGVLLGAWAPIDPNASRILDIGTGTGLIALMIAQRFSKQSPNQRAEMVNSQLNIDAIDIDEPSVAEAAENFRNSPWGSVLYAHHASDRKSVV